MPVTFYPKLHLRFDNLYAKYEDFKLKWLSLLGIAPSWMIGCLAKKPFCFCGCSKAFPCLEEGQHWINQFFWYRKVCEDDDPSCQGLDLIVWHSFFFIGLPHKKRYEITTHKILGSRRIFSCKLNFWLCFFWLYFFFVRRTARSYTPLTLALLGSRGNGQKMEHFIIFYFRLECPKVRQNIINYLFK